MLSIPRYVKVIWSKWNIRVFILLSLSVQVFLIFFAPLRKRTSNRSIIFLVWTAYLLADFIAVFVLGLIANEQGNNQYTNPSCDLMALWAPFCLIHLGGPDTITAYSLQDTALWVRHLIGLLFQVIVSLYVFIESLPSNKFWLSISFLFVAGIIKYAERTRALYLATFDPFQAEPCPNYAKLMGEFSTIKQARVPARMKMVQRQKEESTIIASYPDEDENLKNDITVAQHAHYFFKIFRGLSIDQLVLLMSDREESRNYYQRGKPEEAFKVLSAELNFFYDGLYTKALVVHSKSGYVFRIISSLAVLSSFSLFINDSAKHNSNLSSVDVDITYILFGGAIALDIMAFFFMIFSDWTIASWTVVAQDNNSEKKSSCLDAIFNKYLAAIFKKYLALKQPNWPEAQKSPEASSPKMCSSSWVRKFVFRKLPEAQKSPEASNSKMCSSSWVRKFVFRRWSESVHGYNLLAYCLNKAAVNKSGYWRRICNRTIRDLGLTNFQEETKFVYKKQLRKNLWEFIFEEIRKKSELADDVAEAKLMSSAIGDLDVDAHNLLKLYVVEVDYAQSLLLWHIATEICYNNTSNQSEEEAASNQSEEKAARKNSKVLSDYMLYLLREQPTLISPVAGVGEISFADTCAEVKRLFIRAGLFDDNKSNNIVKEACTRILKVDTSIKPAIVKGTKSKSVLFDACILAKELKKFKEKKWMLVSRVWVELLSYAACRCRPNTHLRLLGRGGELITHVWLLMAHFGIGEHLHVIDQDYHAVAKLIVDI